MKETHLRPVSLPRDQEEKCYWSLSLSGKRMAAKPTASPKPWSAAEAGISFCPFKKKIRTPVNRVADVFVPEPSLRA